MDREQLLKRITVNPDVLVGKPTIRGMRISVEQILEALAAGVPERELLEDYPMLERDDIRAALLYARADWSIAPGNHMPASSCCGCLVPAGRREYGSLNISSPTMETASPVAFASIGKADCASGHD